MIHKYSSDLIIVSCASEFVTQVKNHVLTNQLFAVQTKESPEELKS